MKLTLFLAGAILAAAKDTVPQALCKKACIFPHDAAVIACKATKSGWWAHRKCVWEAARRKRACEASCMKKGG